VREALQECVFFIEEQYMAGAIITKPAYLKAKAVLQTLTYNPSGAAATSSRSQENVPDPPAAGPVWVKVTERTPNDTKPHPVRSVGGRYYEGWMDTGMFQITGVFCAPKDYALYEWLDESEPVQQVFTREQVGAMFAKLSTEAPAPSSNFFTKWFESNFPPPINK
jgi:hypothetical protein